MGRTLLWPLVTRKSPEQASPLTEHAFWRGRLCVRRTSVSPRSSLKEPCWESRGWLGFPSQGPKGREVIWPQVVAGAARPIGPL